LTHRVMHRRKAGCCGKFARMKILLVEDSSEVSCITVEYLHELGHSVEAVAEAELAIAKLGQESFDAVMTDVRLPGMSGIELARALTKSHPTLPVVIASGYGTLNVELMLGEKTRTVLMLPKPYDLDALAKTLNEAASLSN
jgi:DNA-binding NtrC family response regulator